MELDALFETLDRWRHFPAYQLERRADVFFSLYLAEVVAAETGVPLQHMVIPELPVKHPHDNQSGKVDYALFSEDARRAFLVELKTDQGSRRSAQDDYLFRAEEQGLHHVLEGLLEIVLATKARAKYFHLLTALAEAGCLRIPADAQDFIWPESRPGQTDRLRSIEVVVPRDATIDVLYVQPTATPGDRCIDFQTFARHVAAHDDPLSRTFAGYLERWRVPAGSVPPPG